MASFGSASMTIPLWPIDAARRISAAAVSIPLSNGTIAEAQTGRCCGLHSAMESL